MLTISPTRRWTPRATLAILSLLLIGCADVDGPRSGETAGDDQAARSGSTERGVSGGPSPDSRAAPPAAIGAVVGSVPPATRGYPSVVILESDTPIDRAIPDEPAVMDQYGMEFVPKLLVVQAGRTVEFGNSEDVAHNVHVVDLATVETLINAATPFSETSVEHTFASPGVYSVLCGVHSTMAAMIVVTENSYHVIADADGSFVLPDVPHGSYTLRIWSIDEARRSERPVEVAGERTEVAIDF